MAKNLAGEPSRSTKQSLERSGALVVVVVLGAMGTAEVVAEDLAAEEETTVEVGALVGRNMIATARL